MTKPGKERAKYGAWWVLVLGAVAYFRHKHKRVPGPDEVYKLLNACDLLRFGGRERTSIMRPIRDRLRQSRKRGLIPDG